MLAKDKWPIIPSQDFYNEMQSLDKSRKFIPVNIAVLTVSDSRTSENDIGDYLELAY